MEAGGRRKNRSCRWASREDSSAKRVGWVWEGVLAVWPASRWVVVAEVVVEEVVEVVRVVVCAAVCVGVCERVCVMVCVGKRVSGVLE